MVEVKLKNIKKTNGITLVTLSITVVVILIIAGISVYEGKEIIQNAKLESLRTNMLLIQAKSKEYVEEATFRMGINPNDAKKEEIRKAVYEQEAGLEKATTIPSEFGYTDASLSYWFTQTAQENWGLDEIELKSTEKYLIRFDEANETVEVYNTVGFEGEYSLTNINQIEF